MEVKESKQKSRFDFPDELEVEKLSKKQIIKWSISGVLLIVVLLIGAIWLFKEAPYTNLQMSRQIRSNRYKLERDKREIGDVVTVLEQQETGSFTGFFRDTTIDTTTQGNKMLPGQTVTMIDTAKFRELELEILSKEIDSIKALYVERREALLKEAVSFLRSSEGKEAAIGKAKGFEDLAKKLRESIYNFPQTVNDAQAKLWEVQKNELAKTASLAEDIAQQYRATNGDRVQMRRTAERLKMKGAL